MVSRACQPGPSFLFESDERRGWLSDAQCRTSASPVARIVSLILARKLKAGEEVVDMASTAILSTGRVDLGVRASD